ncbi:uncharacterized protein G2W53_043924 [Senna tora]|uniref:Uncharacterized protein n=1 Tax=Senna tora TaxID=362788 RepID=A0A834W0K0_9FABA|nr:uncharacterized protein G2W53_043924 [Senna tora]
MGKIICTDSCGADFDLWKLAILLLITLFLMFICFTPPTPRRVVAVYRYA